MSKEMDALKKMRNAVVMSMRPEFDLRFETARAREERLEKALREIASDGVKHAPEWAAALAELALEEP